MTHQLIDNGDGTGVYQGWKLRQGWDKEVWSWITYPPYELADGGKAIWCSIRGNTWVGTGYFARGVDGTPWAPFPRIEQIIDRFEAARERLMAAAFQDGPDESDRLVRVER